MVRRAGTSGSVPAVGCGAWTELFAQRYGRIVGVDASVGMLAAARRRLAGQGDVELVHGDAVTVTLNGKFEGVLLGGLLMYLDRADAGCRVRWVGSSRRVTSGSATTRSATW